MLAKRFDHVVVFFDNEDQAQAKADQLMYDLAHFNVKCENIMNTVGDPDNLSDEEAREIMRDFNLL